MYVAKLRFEHIHKNILLTQKFSYGQDYASVSMETASRGSLHLFHDANIKEHDPKIRHVLLISVDGLHALDLARYVRTYPHSALAGLSKDSVTFSNTSTSEPSDSFPGILSMTTGGTPRSTGVFYDDSHDRKLSPPGSKCAIVGTEVVYDGSHGLVCFAHRAPTPLSNGANLASVADAMIVGTTLPFY